MFLPFSGRKGVQVDDIARENDGIHLSLSCNKINVNITVTHSTIKKYSGIMYYDLKEAGHWVAIYSVVKDLDAYIQV